MKKLVVNADDFGFTRDVNRGIFEAHCEGILTATTLMANGAAFDDAVHLGRQTPTLDIGVHLVLVGERPYPPSVAHLSVAVALGRIRIYEEFASQVRKILDAGIRPTHLDTHKHTHLLPQVLDAIGRCSHEFQIPWVRRPFDAAIPHPGVPAAKRITSRLMSLRRSGFAKVLAQYGCRSTDHFSGFQITGDYDAARLAAIIRGLPEGSTEFMCHPGICGGELSGARTRLKESREQELRALTSPEVRKALRESGVILTNYAGL
jgi:chitin disaccharide deacetylase